MSSKNPMALFDGEPVAFEPKTTERPPSKRELQRLQAAERRAQRAAASRWTPTQKAPLHAPQRTLAQLYADNHRERERIRSKWYGRFGVEPPQITDDPKDQPAADAEANARVRAAIDRYAELAKEGWTFIRGHQERFEDWERDRLADEAEARAKKAEEARQRAETKAARRKQIRLPGGALVGDWTDM